MVALAFLFATGASALGQSDSALKDFQEFWTQFRGAALSGKSERCLALTAFPFKTRGPTDADPVRTHSQAEFPGLLAALLAQDSGLAAEPLSMREYIAHHPMIQKKLVRADGLSARVGTFVFEKRAGEWRFVQSYTEEVDPKP